MCDPAQSRTLIFVNRNGYPALKNNIASMMPIFVNFKKCIKSLTSSLLLSFYKFHSLLSE